MSVAVTLVAANGIPVVPSTTLLGTPMQLSAKAQRDAVIADREMQAKLAEIDRKIANDEAQRQHDQRMREMEIELKEMDLELNRVRLQQQREKPKPTANGAEAH